MGMKKTKFARLFGSGPLGTVISLILLIAAWRLNKLLDWPPISNNQFALLVIFIVSILISIALFVWSFKSLPASDRGNKLCTSGAFKYFRHPLYAAFLSSFNFGLAIYLNSYVYVLWAALLHPVWHFIIRREEKMMVDIFPGEYVEYQKKTGRFFPRWSSLL